MQPYGRFLNFFKIAIFLLNENSTISCERFLVYVSLKDVSKSHNVQNSMSSGKSDYRIHSEFRGFLKDTLGHRVGKFIFLSTVQD